jgi:hypothetical protein
MDLGKNVVLGTALAYGPRELNNFVKSFREFNKDDDLVLIVDKDNRLFEFFEKYQVTPIFFESRFFMSTHINNARFIRYLEFMLDNITKYDRVFLTDTRDIVFQDNVFKDLSFEFMHFFAEDEKVTIGSDQTYNTPWIKMVFGDEIYNQMKDKRIICAGTTLGSTGNIMKYLNMMVDIFRQLKNKNTNAYSINVDQGIHNFIAHNTHYFTEGSIKDNGDIVATIGLTLNKDPGKIRLDGDVMYVSDMKPAVIHQYDRSPKLVELYHKKYE